jgi:hypothetical protein
MKRIMALWLHCNVFHACYCGRKRFIAGWMLFKTPVDGALSRGGGFNDGRSALTLLTTLVGKAGLEKTD